MFAGFSIGFWEYFICVLIVALGYGCMTLCIAEITSVIAFPGGFYGYVRCGLGPLPGYIVGCSALVETTYFLAVSVLKLGQACSRAFNLTEEYEPIFWGVAYIVMMTFHMQGGRWFWNFMEICVFGSLAIFLIYLFGSMPLLNFSKYAYIGNSTSTLEFNIGAYDFLNILRLPGWFFLGMDTLSLTCEEVQNVRR